MSQACCRTAGSCARAIPRITYWLRKRRPNHYWLSLMTPINSRNRNLSSEGERARVSSVDSLGRTIWIADAHRGDGKRFVVRADEKLTAFVELESAIRAVTQNQIVAGRRLAWSDWARYVPTPDGLKKDTRSCFSFPKLFSADEFRNNA